MRDEVFKQCINKYKPVVRSYMSVDISFKFLRKTIGCYLYGKTNGRYDTSPSWKGKRVVSVKKP